MIAATLTRYYNNEQVRFTASYVYEYCACGGTIWGDINLTEAFYEPIEQTEESTFRLKCNQRDNAVTQ